MNGNRLKNERWREIERIFDAALEVDVDARAAFLANACNGDAALRQEVESLLASYCKAGDFLASPADKATAVKLASALRQKQNGHVTGAATAVTDERFGAYQLIRELAEGGMGTVWMARRADDQFQQQVAIKLLKAGATSEDLLHRFRHERQILAGLNHPNIARLLDGGTTPDGRPYIVMEYVEGVPIDEYCPQHQLSIRERLTLFRQVCAAVHYAHQNLLVHRDLKPGNILVTADGTPKLLDFGIAKLLQPDLTKSYDTATGLNPMTPAYASPEQVRGEKLTTASDVYSLGVVLYELLTGHSPYRLQANTYGELVKAVCEQEPERPSTAVTQNALRGDVDSIVLMALRKEPRARYSSVEQFSEDIRRYLEGLPTVARKGTFGYHAAKYLRRNRLPVAAVALIFLTLLGGIGATLRQARIALAAQHNAEAQQAKAEAQRQRAENALATAEDSRQQADATRTEADQQRVEAIAQREQANEQRAFADQQRQRAETQEMTSQRLLYTSRMGLAQQAWDEANVGRMRDLLSPYLPQAGAPDFRGFEWYYLWKLSHPELEIFTIPGGVQWAVFSTDGRQLLTVVRKQQGNSAPPTTEVLFRDILNGQVRHTLDLPTATMTVVARDRMAIALARHGDGEISLIALPGGAELHKITGLKGGLSCLDFSPDGKQLIAGFYDGSLSLIDLATRQEAYKIKPHTERVFTVAVAPDGQKFVSGSNDRSARLWTLSSGKELLTFDKGLYLPQNSLFSPDGRLVVVSGSGRTTIWEVASGKQLAQLMRKGRRMAFTPDSRALVIGGEDAERESDITVFDTTTWQETSFLRGHGNSIMSLALSPDGKLLASGSLDKTIKLWDLNRDLPPAFIDDQRKLGEFTQVVLTPDGKRLLTGQWNQSATVWDVATGKEIMTLQGHAQPPNNSGFKFSVAVSADSQWYATGGGADAQVKIWEASTGKESKSFKASSPVNSLSFSPNGLLLAVGSGNLLQLWEPGSGKVHRLLQGQQGAIIGLSFSPDGKSLFVANANGKVRVWDASTGQTLREYLCGDTTILSFALARDGRMFVTGGGDSAQLWDVQTGQQLFIFKGHSSPVSALAFTPDGRRLATGSRDRSIRLWNVTTGEELILLKGHNGWIADNSIGFSQDGRLFFSADWRRVVKFWRATTEQEILARRN